MFSKAILHSIRQCVVPSPGVEQRIWRRVATQTSMPVLHELRRVLEAPKEYQQSIWMLIQEQLVVPYGFFSNIRFVKWGAGVVAAVVVLKLMPALFVVTPISAQSRVMVFPTQGEVSVSSGDTGWLNLTKEQILYEHSIVRTRDGEATVILHDDGVIRLAPYTAIELHDLSNRPVGLDSPTLTLIHGKIWVQGLLPTYVEPLHIAMSYGDMLLHEGSVSIEEGTTVTVSVWDRRATILHDTERLPLVAGEQTWLWERNIPTVQRVTPEILGQTWVSQNLDRDAVHRRDIALLEREERIAIAGILPTSSLYPVKRVAEDIDLFLTFGKEAKVRKQLKQASRRLNEASALIVAGGEPEQLLVEYRDILQTLGGLVSDEVFAELIEQVLREDTASIGVAFPGEEGYLLKQAVLEATATVGSDGSMHLAELEGVLVGDALMALSEYVRLGQVIAAYDGFTAIKPFIDSNLAKEDLGADLRKEIKTFLSDLALSVQRRRNTVGDINASFYNDIVTYLPMSPQPPVIHLTDEEVQKIAHSIVARVLNTFNMRRSRENQLFTEIRAVRGHPDRARILRRLYQDFAEEPWYAAYVREEMKFLREEQGLL
ncbi:hypothetical protein HYZ98_05235 [Candidatus Peregrinibacteria bacterium]|nr:hypothetical protein [Candidatus Peregrinibacteria bacterium]